jgi:ABC-type glycerol-3-phosphate transport system substrate-binding protein
MMGQRLSAGTAPDLFEWWPPAQWAAKGSVIAIDDLPGSSKAIAKSAFLDVSLKEGSWKGKLYGLPALEHLTRLTTVFNEDLFQKQGLKILGDLHQTFEEALQQSKRYTTFDGAGNVDLLWYTFNYDKWQWQWQ